MCGRFLLVGAIRAGGGKASVSPLEESLHEEGQTLPNYSLTNVCITDAPVRRSTIEREVVS